MLSGAGQACGRQTRSTPSPACGRVGGGGERAHSLPSLIAPPPYPSSRSRMYPTSADQEWPNSGKAEFGCKRGRESTEYAAQLNAC